MPANVPPVAATELVTVIELMVFPEIVETGDAAAVTAIPWKVVAIVPV